MTTQNSKSSRSPRRPMDKYLPVGTVLVDTMGDRVRIMQIRVGENGTVRNYLCVTCDMSSMPRIVYPYELDNGTFRGI